MEGVLVGLDVLHHDSQAGFFLGQVVFLGGFPQGGVALNAIRFLRRVLLVRSFRIGNVLVAGDAL